MRSIYVLLILSVLFLTGCEPEYLGYQLENGKVFYCAVFDYHDCGLSLQRCKDGTRHYCEHNVMFTGEIVR